MANRQIASPETQMVNWVRIKDIMEDRLTNGLAGKLIGRQVDRQVR